MRVTIKAFSKGLICRGMAYKPYLWNTAKSGDIHEGLHSCEFALDVLGYYAVWEQNEYWLCLIDGAMDEDGQDTRVSATRLKPVKRLTREEFMAQAGRYLMENPHALGDLRFFRGSVHVRGHESTNLFYTVVGEDPSVVSDVLGATILLVRTDRELREAKGFSVINVDGEKYLPGITYKLRR